MDIVYLVISFWMELTVPCLACAHSSREATVLLMGNGYLPQAPSEKLSKNCDPITSEPYKYKYGVVSIELEQESF